MSIDSEAAIPIVNMKLFWESARLRSRLCLKLIDKKTASKKVERSTMGLEQQKRIKDLLRVVNAVGLGAERLRLTVCAVRKETPFKWNGIEPFVRDALPKILRCVICPTLSSLVHDPLHPTARVERNFQHESVPKSRKLLLKMFNIIWVTKNSF